MSRVKSKDVTKPDIDYGVSYKLVRKGAACKATGNQKSLGSKKTRKECAIAAHNLKGTGFDWGLAPLGGCWVEYPSVNGDCEKEGFNYYPKKWDYY